jgi:hypothetical protein
VNFAPALVTPAYGRLDLSAVVFDQRAATLAELLDAGIDARVYVVADDENLDLARERGFEVVERANDFLGAKFNDGIEAAVLDGATHVATIGSDSWIDPEYLRRVDPEFPGVTTGLPYAVVDESGERIGLLLIRDRYGVGPHVVPVSLLEAPYRPIEEDIPSGCDGSLLERLERTTTLRLKLVYVDPVQYVGFRTLGEQINPYESLVSGDVAERSPWPTLRRVFPSDLVDVAERLYADRRARLVA